MTSNRSIAMRVITGLIAGGAMVHVATLLPTAADLYRAVPANGRIAIVTLSTTILVALIACALAILLVVRAGARYEARTLALFLVLVSLCWGSVLRFASVDVEARELGIEATGWPVIIAALTLALSAAALLRLSWHFPFDFSGAGKAGRLRRFLGRRGVAWGLALLAPLLLQTAVPVVMWLVRLSGRSPGDAAGLLGITIVATFWTIVALVVGMGSVATWNFVAGYRMADDDARRAALWLVVGITGTALANVAVGAAFLIEVLLPGDAWSVPSWMLFVPAVSPLFAVGCIAIAVLYSGAVDPSLALRRSTINGIAGTVGLLVFAGLENTLSAWVESRLGLPGLLGSFLAGAVAAGAFLPIQRVLTRRGGRN